jgi:hypothetical protein
MHVSSPLARLAGCAVFFFGVATLLGPARGALSSRALAQDCGCDRVIEPGVTNVDGEALGLAPGDVVCVMAGRYEGLRFRAIRGSDVAPVIIVNCGGVVDVRAPPGEGALVVDDASSHFRLTGAGDPSSEYGFRLSAPARVPEPGVGLALVGRSTDYEVDHVELAGTGGTGIVAHTDPVCDSSADQHVFVQRDVRLHHLFIHDTGGEGLRAGSSQWAGHTLICAAGRVLHQPHFLDGLEIDHVRVERSSGSGIGIGMARSACSVHDDVVTQVGTAGGPESSHALDIGTYSRCDVRRNTFVGGPASGVFVVGGEGTTIGDNVVADFGERAVHADLSPSVPSASYRVAHNTLVDFGASAIDVRGEGVTSDVWNNLVVGAPSDVQVASGVAVSLEGNTFVARASDADFYGPRDYRLRASSPARGAGIDHAAEGFVLDRAGRVRASPPSAGAYEYDPAAPEPQPSPGAGCSCAAVRGASATTILASPLACMVVLCAWLACARRRRTLLQGKS